MKPPPDLSDWLDLSFSFDASLRDYWWGLAEDEEDGFEPYEGACSWCDLWLEYEEDWWGDLCVECALKALEIVEDIQPAMTPSTARTNAWERLDTIFLTDSVSLTSQIKGISNRFRPQARNCDCE